MLLNQEISFMHNYTSISREDAIAKFGHHFVLETSKNRFGFDIVEKLGKSSSLFDDDDDDMCFDAAVGSLQGKVLINSKKTIIYNDIMMKSFASKVELFIYRKGWYNAEKTKRMYDFLAKDEMARQNLIDIDNFDFKSILKPLPEQFHLPATYFEKDKVYYQFKHSNNSYHFSEVIEVTPSNIDVSYNKDNMIEMKVSFKNLAGEDVNGQVSVHRFREYNANEVQKPYFETGYSDIFVFIDKDECKKFAIEKINKDIEHFQQSIAALS